MGGGPEVGRAVMRALVGAVAFGLLLAVVYHASLLRGALTGLLLWGPAVVLSARWRAVPDEQPLDAFGP